MQTQRNKWPDWKISNELLQLLLLSYYSNTVLTQLNPLYYRPSRSILSRSQRQLLLEGKRESCHVPR